MMSQLRWNCSSCAKNGAINCEDPPNPYIEGYRIYKEHAEKSPDCPSPFTTIQIEMSVLALLNHQSIQREFDRIKSIGGRVEIDGNKITIFSGILPEKTDMASTFAERIRRIDAQGILDVKVKHEK